MSVTDDTGSLLRTRAAEVLHGNDAGGWTRASPHLYPHQWSWDSAFIAIGWAHLDPRRAISELEQLFAAQWQSGMVPHIVFRGGPGVPYFPGPEWWDCTVTPPPPAVPLRTTGICQPPVHALALQRIWQLTPAQQRPEIRARLQALYPGLVRWHRYLATRRDPEGSGLVTTYHPWEGTDNSPRWDRALARIKVARPGPYTRLDTSELGDASQRPTDWDYDRYLWLVGELKDCGYDDAEIYRQSPFLIKDVFFSSVLVAANAALLDLADVAGAAAADREDLTRWLARGLDGLASRVDPESGLCLDLDVRTGEEIRLRTFASFAPLFARTPDAGQAAAQLRLLDSGDFCGARGSAGACCQHQPRRARVPAAQLLARPGLADHRLAAVAIPERLGYRTAQTTFAATRWARSPRAGTSPSTTSRSPGSRSARRGSPGPPPSRWTGWAPCAAVDTASRPPPAFPRTGRKCRLPRSGTGSSLAIRPARRTVDRGDRKSSSDGCRSR